MNISNKIIWVLKDDRPGNYSQGTGLAESMAEIIPSEIQIKKITYNFLSKLPNFLKIDGMMGIKKSSCNALLDQSQKLGQKPDIIISAGRKTAPIAAFLKNKYQAFAIQIMNPNLDFSKFDLVVLPNHDRENPAKNVVRIIGSLTKIKDEFLKSEYEKFVNILEKTRSPKIALLVGGSSKKGTFTNEIAKNLGEISSRITNEMGGSLLVLNSRRTGEKITETLDKNLNCPKIFFKWKKGDWKNPYFAVLQTADFIIATGDSISMCAEICSIGKPIYIFNPAEICSPKHLKFHQDLFDQNFAKKLDNNTNILENYSSNKLAETKRVAQVIIDDLYPSN